MTQLRQDLREVEHLLVTDMFGLRPFHTSLLAFVAQLPEHEDYKQPLHERIVQWLKTSAPEYFRWRYEWILAAELGDDQSLRDGPSREWIVEAVYKCRLLTDVDFILSRSIKALLKARNLPRRDGTGNPKGLRSYARTL